MKEVRSSPHRGARGRRGRPPTTGADAPCVDQAARPLDEARRRGVRRGRPSAHDWDAAIRKTLTMLGAVPTGHVAAHQCHQDRSAHFGEPATSLASRGVAGCVIDGGCRDCAGSRRRGFPVFASSRPRTRPGGGGDRDAGADHDRHGPSSGDWVSATTTASSSFPSTFPRRPRKARVEGIRERDQGCVRGCGRFDVCGRFGLVVARSVL